MAKKEYYTILKTVFDNIFELNYAEKTLRYICSTEDVLFCSDRSFCKQPFAEEFVAGKCYIYPRYYQ